MNTILIDRLKRQEAKHHHMHPVTKRQLRVFYGWAKLGKIRRREAISVIYENQDGVADHHRMGKVLGKAQHTVCWRCQTEGEAEDSKYSNRVFTEYSIFLDDKKIGGSLEKALDENSRADENNVTLQERQRIADALRQHFMSEHRDYREPEHARQLKIQWKD